MSEDFELNAGNDASQRREHAEPLERDSPIPKVVLGLAALACAFGGAYILAQQRDDAPALGDRRSARVLAAQPGRAAGSADGAQLFAANCAACHQAQGTGLPGVFPPLAGSEWVNGPPGRLAKIVLHGINGSLSVLGQSYNGQMPSFRDKLSDQELAALLSHVRSHFGNSANALDAAAVRAARAATANRTAPWDGQHELDTIE